MQVYLHNIKFSSHLKSMALFHDLSLLSKSSHTWQTENAVFDAKKTDLPGYAVGFPIPAPVCLMNV